MVLSFLRRRNIATSKARSEGRVPSSQQKLTNVAGETGAPLEEAIACMSRNSVGVNEIAVPDNSIWPNSAFREKFPIVRFLMDFSGVLVPTSRLFVTSKVRNPSLNILGVWLFGIIDLKLKINSNCSISSRVGMLAFLFNAYMTPTVSRPSKMGETMPWVKPDCLAQAGIETPRCIVGWYY